MFYQKNFTEVEYLSVSIFEMLPRFSKIMTTNLDKFRPAAFVPYGVALSLKTYVPALLTETAIFGLKGRLQIICFTLIYDKIYSAYYSG